MDLPIIRIDIFYEQYSRFYNSFNRTRKPRKLVHCKKIFQTILKRNITKIHKEHENKKTQTFLDLYYWKKNTKSKDNARLKRLPGWFEYNWADNGWCRKIAWSIHGQLRMLDLPMPVLCLKINSWTIKGAASSHAGSMLKKCYTTKGKMPRKQHEKSPQPFIFKH